MTGEHRIPIWAGFALALITVAVVGVASYRLANRFERDSEWVAHTRTVIIDLQNLQEAVVDAEDASRNYILFGDRAYRDEISAARAGARTELEQLRRLVTDNPAQMERLDPLARMVAARLAIMDRALALRQSAGRDAAIANAVSSPAAGLMAQIRGAIAAMLKTEDELLVARRAAAQSAASWTARVMVGGTAAACIFVLFAGIYIERALFELRAATERAQAAAADAEEQHRLVQEQNQALIRSQARVQRLLEAAPDAILVTNERGEITFANPLARAMFGYRDEELAGAPIEMLIASRLRARHIEHRSEYLQAPRARLMGEGLELYARRKDGSEFPVDVRLNPIEDDGGMLVSCVIRDLTERRRAERKEALLTALVESVQYAIASIAPDGTVLTWNAGAEHVYGYRADEMVGRSIEVLLPPEQRYGWQQRMSALVQGPGASESEGQRVRKDGKLIDVAIAAAPIRGPRSGGYALATISYDITDRRRAERELAARSAELARSNAELEQFAYVTSHDLQEPLRMVASYLQLIQQRYSAKLDSDADQFINFAVDGAVRMKQLINDLLQYSRAGRSTPVGRVNLEAVLGRVRSALAIAAAEGGAEITHDPLPAVLGDESGMYEVLQNLIGNAIKFRGEQPARIHISARRDGSDWVIAVRDHGIGIAPEHRERIFVMFQRLHGREEYLGTGIGLAICKRIVERLGGRIWVESVPERGANFLFTVRAAEPEEDIQSAAQNG
jgi:PAS domain S-box-containing protein